MDFELSEEHRSLLREVKEFCRKECGNIDIGQLEESGDNPDEVEKKLLETGWYGLPFPTEYGGLGRGFFDAGLAVRGLVRWGYPYPGLYQLVVLNALNLFENGSEKQRREILTKVIRGELTVTISVTEPNAGSDIASLTTKAVQRDGGFSITGQKVFSSGAAGENNMIILAARTHPTEKRHKGITLFLVPAKTKGLEFIRLQSMGRRIGGLYEVFLDEVWVPEENVLGELHGGWKALTKGFNAERAIATCGYLGFAERIFADIVKSSRERSCNDKQLGNYSCIAQQIAELAIEIQAAELLSFRSLYLAEEGKPGIEEVSQSKVYLAELTKKLGDVAMQMAGGNGYLMSSMTQWFFRESKISTIGGGSSQMMRTVAAAALGLKQAR
ncbi:MAG: acyl-CoA/acyl-ACP dehydrogenase [Deltaproteobacteria bacterium]|nr:acyl-CoA/acyl-ACP dehydrogenase [Deltaproteobacteria bacterium]